MKFSIWISWKEFTGRKKGFLIHILSAGLISGFCVFIAFTAGSREQAVKSATYTISPAIRIFPQGLRQNTIIEERPGGKAMDQKIIDEIANEYRDSIGIASGRLIFRYSTGKTDILFAGSDPSKMEMLNSISRLGENEAASGSEAARIMNLAAGGTVNAGNISLVIMQVMQSAGTAEDTALLIPLNTAQNIARMKGSVNVIDIYLKAGVSAADVLPDLRKRFPDFNIQAVDNETAGSREMESTLAYYSSVFYIICAVILSIYLFASAVLNAMERKTEIAMLYAIGVPGKHITAMLIGRAIAVGAAGSLAGCASGVILFYLADFNALPSAAAGALICFYIVGASMLISLVSTLPGAVISGYRNHVRILQDSWI